MKLTVYENGIVKAEPSEKPEAKDGFSLFRVKACGICGSDLPRVFANSSYYYPIVLGHEFAGIVEDSKNPDLIGKRACVFPILPCGECAFCQRGQWANCVQYDYYGSRRDGGMQDYLLVKDQNLVFLPDNVSYEAGSMVEPMAVCLHAVRKTGIERGMTVAVWGAGTIGLLVAMWAKALGAERILLSDPDARRMAFAESLGFAALGDETPDVAIEASGAPAALNAAIGAVRTFGRVVLVGNTGGDVTIARATYSQILRKQLTLCGSWNSDFRADSNDWKDAIDAIAKGMISPERLITHRFPLKRGDEAFRLIGERREFYNKITVVM